MWKAADVHIHPERCKDPELQEAHLKGMVGKYTVDVGWETAMCFYNIYRESGEPLRMSRSRRPSYSLARGK